MKISAFRLVLPLLLIVPSHAEQPPAADWPDTYLARVQAMAIVQTLNVDLLASRSATLTLERWCRDHSMAANPTVTAEPVRGSEPKAATAEQRERLQAGPDEEIRYRHVRLQCGGLTLSEADNWYVPQRLSAEMNRLLETTDTPFGKVVQALEPYRRTFLVRRLWQPLPDGWETAPPSRKRAAPRTPMTIPNAIFEHRAILYTRGNLPFSEVDEIYQRQLLSFRLPVRE